jgi:hypothetical protein
LYQDDISIDVRLSDLYMGIQTVEWSVISDYDSGQNQSGRFEIDNEKKLKGDRQNWKIASKNQNLVNSLTNTFTIKNDSNDIKILFQMTDRAGFTTKKEVVVSIDKRAPVIEVTYDNNNYDQEFVNETEFYKEPRTATIRIFERNFDENKVETTITNKDGSIPELSGWTEERNEEQPDTSIYVATIYYEQDGDYTFDITAEDKVGNTAIDFEEDKFTIDTTLPIIKIEFDNNQPANGMYYKEKRTATITIEEHNFETTRIEITGTAANGTTNLPYPKPESWFGNGDIHTATIEYEGDALYTLNVAYKDKAGNEAKPIEADEFYIDENAPVIEFGGVENMSAYNGTVAPVIFFKDININRSSVKVYATVVKETGAVQFDGDNMGNIEEGNGECRLVINDFSHTEKFDGVYTLEAEVYDMAENVTKNSITFSVNRFGSVYTLSNEVRNIDGEYIKEPIDIVITETNVNSIDVNKIQIKLTKNGVPSDLTLGQDYTVNKSGGEHSWNQYTYTIDAETFSGDGIYIISMNSIDEAGNVNDNTNEAKKAEVWFGIDGTEPVIIPLDVESHTTYNETNKQATISIEDNLLLEEVKIYLNGKEQTYQEENGTYTFTITDSNKSQKIEIIARDAAGNETVKEIENFFVTTNLIIRMLHNTAAMAACASVTVGSVGGVTLFRRRFKLLRWLKKRITK